jgi:hypothetical protein
MRPDKFRQRFSIPGIGITNGRNPPSVQTERAIHLQFAQTPFVYAQNGCGTAGNGNRTRMASLEGWNFTIKLCPHGNKLPLHTIAAKLFL